jgi:hypothetical protein
MAKNKFFKGGFYNQKKPNNHKVDTGEYVITKGKEQKNINSLCLEMPVKPVKCEPFHMSSEMRKMIDGMIKDLDEQIKQLKK